MKPEQERTEIMKIFGNDDFSALNQLSLMGKIKKVNYEKPEKEKV